ncbi:MAG TPA: NAD(P)H-dependent oxidoreductase [Glaciibacter sp.]|nr:NAD(P)H-dependent oxidoreductase [Glaciibacter sp.]
MHVLIVFDHPYGASASTNVPHQRSLSAALLAASVAGLGTAGHSADVIDLAADRFNPVLTESGLRGWRLGTTVDPQVLSYQRRLAAADHLVFIHPTGGWRCQRRPRASWTTSSPQALLHRATPRRSAEAETHPSGGESPC